jgi:hypothetical protein
MWLLIVFVSKADITELGFYWDALSVAIGNFWNLPIRHSGAGRNPVTSVCGLRAGANL